VKRIPAPFLSAGCGTHGKLKRKAAGLAMSACPAP
jgi:hypothetical protein